MSYIPDSVLNEQSKTVVNKVGNVLFSSSLIYKQESDNTEANLTYSTKWVIGKVYKGKYSGEENRTVFIIWVEKTSEEVAVE